MVDTEILSQVSNIVQNPPTENKFETLKNQLVEYRQSGIKTS